MNAMHGRINIRLVQRHFNKTSSRVVVHSRDNNNNNNYISILG